MAHRSGATRSGSNPGFGVSKKSARSPLSSTSTASVRRPRSELSRARAAAVVLLPTPPLRVTTSGRRSSRSAGFTLESRGFRPVNVRWTGLPGRSRGFRPVNVRWTGLPGRSWADRGDRRAEADAAVAAGGTDLHVGQLVGRDPDPAALAVR